MVCRKCHQKKQLVTGKPFCFSCNSSFNEWLGTMDYNIEREELRRNTEDMRGYEDIQWRVDLD